MITAFRTSLRRLGFGLLLAVLPTLVPRASGAEGRSAHPPILFVHGNGDTAALWMTTIWRFESNGWPRERLRAIDLPLPLARDDDSMAQPGRSSAADVAREIAAEVERIRQQLGVERVVLVGNSRGGLAIRNYIQNFGGAPHVSHAILGGVPNHGVWANPALRPGNEFNGAGPFLTALNAPKEPQGREVTSGVAWLTLRSDRNDKFAQPDGIWMGAGGMPTGVTFDGPALLGATNVSLIDRDHREVSYHPDAFVESFRFLTGRAPATTGISPETSIILNGNVTGYGEGGQTNLPVPGAAVEIYAVDPESGARLGGPRHAVTVDDTGRWGPLTAEGNTHYEFVVTAPGHAITHVYRTPFPRSSSVVHLRAERPLAAENRPASVVIMSRPRGYFGLPRDRVVLDGRDPAPGIPPGVAGVSTTRVDLAGGVGRPVVGEFTSGHLRERLVGIAHAAAENRVVILELQP
jgi:pimeloyl-ACP methyl ester carboxylesterase